MKQSNFLGKIDQTRFYNLAPSPEQKKMLLAKRLKQALKLKDISNSTFAEKIGKRPSEITKWLSGHHNFTISTIFEIEEKLGVTLMNMDLSKKLVRNGVKSSVKPIEVSISNFDANPGYKAICKVAKANTVNIRSGLVQRVVNTQNI
jgi:hypothetical protein